MSTWRVAPCLLVLRDEFNALSPHRDKGADGTIGDAAHQSETSDHNPDSAGWVKALDVDSTGPWPATFHTMIMWIVERCRSGAEKRIRYIIHNRVIYHVDDKFAGRAYTGSDPHTNHAHFSCTRTVSVFEGKQSWGLFSKFGDDVALDNDDKAWLAAQFAALGKSSVTFTDKLGGTSTPLGQALFNAEFPPTPGAPRETFWSNMANIRVAIEAMRASLASFMVADAADDKAKDSAIAAVRDAVTALGPAVISGVLSGLPEGVAVTQEQLNTAFTNAMREAFAPR